MFKFNKEDELAKTIRQTSFEAKAKKQKDSLRANSKRIRDLIEELKAIETFH